MAVIQQGKTSRILTVEMKAKELKDTLTKVEKKAVNVTQDNTLVKQFAEALILSARPITPYRDEYKLRDKMKVTDRTKRNVKVDKSGEKHISYGKKIVPTGAENRRYLDKYVSMEDGPKHDDYHNKPDKYYTIRTKHTYTSEDLKLKSALLQYAAEARVQEIEDWNYDEGGWKAKQKGYHKISEAEKAQMLKENEKRFREAERYSKLAEKYKKDETKYADRPPHLRDSYFIDPVGNAGRVSIKYSVKKTPDKQFVDENTKDYANMQYNTQDVTWKRFTKGTAGRWLEQAIGVNVGPGYKKAKINGKANYKKLVNAFGNEVRKQLQKN